MLFGFGISVLFCHAEINNMNDICSLGIGSTDQEVVWFDISIDEVLLVNGLDSGELNVLDRSQERTKHTICLATITTVLIENRRLQ